MNLEKLISIIVPIYNVEKYLNQCIDSILVQSYTNLEIILVNDGSTDGCAAICDAYAAQDSRVKVIHQENKGLVSARKAGITLASGYYIGYVDGDDWIEPNMYETLERYMDEETVEIVSAECILEYNDKKEYVVSIFSEGKYNKQRLEQEVYGRMLYDKKQNCSGILPGVCSKLFKKSLIYAHQMQVDEEISLGEDAVCTYPGLLEADGLYITGQYLYHYRQRSNSICNNNSIQIDYCRRVSLLFSYLEHVFSQSKYEAKMLAQLDDYRMSMMPSCLTKQFGIRATPFYLFPYNHIERGSKVVLYGAGMVGQIYQKQIMRTGYCDLALWVDVNFKAYSNKNCNVSDVKDIMTITYDVIVIGVIKETIVSEIKSQLIEMGVQKSKIMWEKPVRFKEAFFLS